MSNTATMSNTPKDALKDAKDAVKDASKAAAGGAKDIQADVEALRADIGRLTAQIADLFAAKGNAAWQTAKSSVGDALSGGEDAVDAVREVRDNVVGAIDESLKQRPYTTLALAVGLGFLFGATWRR